MSVKSRSSGTIIVVKPLAERNVFIMVRNSLLSVPPIQSARWSRAGATPVFVVGNCYVCVVHWFGRWELRLQWSDSKLVAPLGCNAVGRTGNTPSLNVEG